MNRKVLSRVSYKSAYQILDTFYTRTSLKEIILNEIEPSSLEGSILFALSEENFEFLEVMVNRREHYSDNYVLFINSRTEIPYILVKDKDLTLLELALICVDCDIEDQHFIDLVESQCDHHTDIDTDETCNNFTEIIKVLRSSNVRK